MTDELDYTALAGMLGETIASAPTLDAVGIITFLSTMRRPVTFNCDE